MPIFGTTGSPEKLCFIGEWKRPFRILSFQNHWPGKALGIEPKNWGKVLDAWI